MSIEKLESRELMAVIPIVSGQTATFRDADGTQVNVKLVGPGQGAIELTNGQLTGASIDSLELTGTSAASKFKISTNGGSVSGTTINELVISKALNELGALRNLKAKNLDFIAGGHFISDGSIRDVQFRSLGANAALDVVGDVNRLRVDTLESNASVEVSGALREFVAQLLNSGTQVSAGQLDMLKVKQYANGTAVEVGQGGLAKAKIANIYYSAISSSGRVGEIHVTGDAFGTAVASNMRAGSDGKFGTIDDFVNDQSGTGSIGTVKIKGAVGAVGTPQEVNLVSSDTIGDVKLSRSAEQLGTTPVLWTEAASQFIPLSISQTALNATGFEDDEIWIAVFGEEISTPGQGVVPPPAQNYYLDPTQLNGSIPVLQSTQPLVPTNGTPDLPILPSFTIEQWKNASSAWGSNLAFPVPNANNEFTGRIVISAGAPVQAQINQDAYHSVSAPSAGNQTDPSTGTFYDFLEFTVSADANGNPSLDIDTSQVDSFGMPMALQFFQDAAGTLPINFTFTGNITNGSKTIQNVTTIQTMVNGGLGTGQPVIGTGIPPGSTIQSYSIDNQTITLNLAASTTTNGVSLIAHAAGPVGVQEARDEILTGTTADALFQFIQNQVTGGNNQARPFLQSAAPYEIAGAIPINAATILPAVITTGSTTGLAVNDVVTIAGVLGATGVNGSFVVANVGATAITLGGPTGNGAYTSGGTWSIPGASALAVTGATNNTSAIVVTTTSTTGLAVNDVVTISGVLGNTAANGTYLVTSLTGTTFTLGSPVGDDIYTSAGTWSEGGGPTTAITGATDGGEILISADSTVGLVNGNTVSISSVDGTTAANGVFVVSNVTSTTFTLDGSTGNAAYTANGTWAMAITGASNPLSPTPGPIVITTTNTAGLQNGDLVQISGVEGYEGANGFFFISNVTPTSFTLDGSTGSGTYTSGGTWSVYAPAGRLVSPKDLVEALLSPQDSNSLNNYYNEVIDAFFLQYLPSTVTLPGGQTGGGQTFELHSAASGTNIQYSGIVTNSFTNNAGYVLRLIDLTGTDLNHYDIYYPFFTTNSPSPDVYTPLFTPLPPPSWITAAGQQSESASQMIFACDAVFADNVARVGIDINASASAVLGDLEDSISAALNRGIALNAADTWGDTTQWYPANGTYNYWVQYWHQTGLTFGDLAYAFPYDDKFGASTNLDVANVGLAQVKLGSWSATAIPTTTAFQTPPASAAPGGQVTLNAQVTGSTPTGFVTFFINGVPINENDYSSSPPQQPVAINGSGLATITANLPALPDGTAPHTYTVTAVYSGDPTHLPSIASYSLLQEDPIALALVPGSGVLGSTPQMQVTLPGTTYNGTVEFTVTRQDGSGGISLGTIDVNAGTIVNNNQIIGEFPFLTSTFTGYTTGGAAGSNAITDISYPAPLIPNTQTITGTGISAATSISTFTPATLTLSAAAVADGAVAIVTNNVTINGTTITGSTTFNVTGVANWTQETVMAGQAVAGANFAPLTTIANFTPASATMNNTTTTTATSPVSISSVANLLNFTGYYNTAGTGDSITGVSSVSNIVPGVSFINGGGLVNALVTGYTPVTLNLSKAAITSGPVQLTCNGVTIWGTTTAGQQGVNVTTVDGWIPTSILESKAITASTVGTLQLNTTVNVFTPATAVFNQTLTNTTSAITFTSNADGKALPITATWTPTNGAPISSTQMFGVT